MRLGVLRRAQVEDATVMLAFGRRYGLIGRNGTGKTTLLRALAGREVKGIPANCQVRREAQGGCTGASWQA
jgi:ATPase subunit of ABC transporter with duplicated ATPase domains